MGVASSQTHLGGMITQKGNAPDNLNYKAQMAQTYPNSLIASTSSGSNDLNTPKTKDPTWT